MAAKISSVGGKAVKTAVAPKNIKPGSSKSGANVFSPPKQAKKGSDIRPSSNSNSRTDNQGLDDFGMAINPHKSSGLPPAAPRSTSYMEANKNRHNK